MSRSGTASRPQQQHPLDEKFPERGDGPYYSVTLAGTFRLQDLLNHLYVLVPVLDAEKHYWIGQDEVERLRRKGEGWLGSHPHKETIGFCLWEKKTLKSAHPPPGQSTSRTEGRNLSTDQSTVREYLYAVLPSLANMQLQHLSDLTPTAWVAQH
ncbi:MAG TPA: hypothetical protein VFO40_23575 [Chthoniobacterales bacterium]|nr:hypothetical protein [Chthoniobacterales bacterium]